MTSKLTRRTWEQHVRIDILLSCSKAWSRLCWLIQISEKSLSFPKISALFNLPCICSMSYGNYSACGSLCPSVCVAGYITPFISFYKAGRVNEKKKVKVKLFFLSGASIVFVWLFALLGESTFWRALKSLLQSEHTHTRKHTYCKHSHGHGHIYTKYDLGWDPFLMHFCRNLCLFYHLSGKNCESYQTVLENTVVFNSMNISIWHKVSSGNLKSHLCQLNQQQQKQNLHYDHNSVWQNVCIQFITEKKKNLIVSCM